jgi:cellulose synthase/poly-beta-1,6-N-acetylglucosamine synthase-like glycosyltransferase
MARLRYRAATLASRTREEAPVRVEAWLQQRTRWMKGWMQTFIVHNHKPGLFFRDIGWRGGLAFEIYVGSLIVSGPLHTLFLFGTLTRATWGLLPGAEPSWAWPIGYLAVLVLGYSGAVAMVIAGLWRLGEQRLLAQQLLLPLYWVLHSIATVRACHQLLVRPYFWAKTAHGRTHVARSVRRLNDG